MVVLKLLGAGSAARAAPYHVAYEGNAYPETEGWERLYGDENGPDQGGATRSLVGGELVLDSLRSPLIHDSYTYRRLINPGPNEEFYCEWRLNVLENNGVLPDNFLSIARDGRGTLALGIGDNIIYSQREFWTLSLDPAIAHTFRIESADMLTYSLFIDGSFARNGMWQLESLNESFVLFGDDGLGGGITSLVSWDYVHFGTVPEPSACVVLLCMSRFVFNRRRRRNVAQHYSGLLSACSPRGADSPRDCDHQ